MRWLWVGDSHLEAMRSQIRDLTAARGIGGMLSYRRGWSSARWLREGDVPGLIARAQPNVVAYVLGTNDDPTNADALRGLVQAARGLRAVWIGPFSTDRHDAEFRAALGSVFVSGSGLARGLPFQSGGNVHLTVEGYRQLAPRLVAAVAGSRSKWVGVAVVAGATLAALGLIALGGSRVFERKWTPAEPHPFDTRHWNDRPMERRAT